MAERIYLAIDLKSFYASVECAERGLDPLTTNLVVADEGRTEKTICLAVSPSLKAYGIPGRARLFEVVQKLHEVNAERKRRLPDKTFSGASSSDVELKNDPSLAVDYIIAKPRMAYYMQYSAEIYGIYLRYVAPEDIHVYSVDEVFIDATDYLKTYDLTPHAFAMKLIREVLGATGITATAGIGTNLYLAKVAMDIVAKHIAPDRDGVRVAELDESRYRQLLWDHRPLTDFWRVGRGYAKKLEANGMFTMGDVARCSVGAANSFYNEELLYKLFGVNAELLIDHAWGWEPCTMADIKAYKPENNSLGAGQVLQCPYDYEKGLLITKEMTDLLALDLVDKDLVTDQIVLTVGYDVISLTADTVYAGAVKTDHYGRRVPKSAHGSINLNAYTASSSAILQAVSSLYARIVDRNLMVRRVYLTANHVIPAHAIPQASPEQLDMFTDYEAAKRQQTAADIAAEKEKQLQEAVLALKKKYGKNAVLKGMNLEAGATTVERNRMIGGHKA